jgi:hypothetical protein
VTTAIEQSRLYSFNLIFKIEEFPHNILHF